MKLLIVTLLVLLLGFETVFFENIFDKIKFLYQTKSIYISAYYTFVSLLGFMSIASLFFLRQKRYFLLAMFLLFLTYAIELVYKEINSMGFGLNELSLALNEGDAFALDALKAYTSSIESALYILAFIFLFVVILRRIIVKKSIFICKIKILFFFLLSLLLAYSITYKTTGATQTRPNLLKMISTSIYYASNRLYYGEREVLTKKATSKEKYKNIILIVDESIGGKYLSINGYEKETTPYLKSIKEHFINLGLASSGANCSAKSNLILMSGIQLEDLPDKEHKALKKPTIFQYAKNAGYKTHYISGQGIQDKLQNHITKYDLEYIDNFTQLKEHYKHKSMPEEHIILETSKVLKSSGKNFIFIVKHGSHFQWEDSYPKEEKYFLPTLEASDALSLKKKPEALNSYLNSVRYNVDLFFKYFLKEISFFTRDDTLIIYTSDHGQSILEEGRSSTHCDSTNPPLSQGLVPLLLFTSTSDKELRTFNFKVNTYNHYQIFPSIQKFMGYEGIEAKTLFEDEEKQIFVSGDIFGRVSLQKNDLKLR